MAVRRAIRVVIALALLVTPTHAASKDALFGRLLSAVEVVGAEAPDALLALVPLQAGQPLSRQALSQGLKDLYQLGVFSRVSASAQVLDDGRVHLLVKVEPIQKIARVSVVGAGSLDEKRLLRAADLPTGAEFTAEAVSAAAERIASEYFKEGWREAEVRWDAFAIAEGLVAVDLSISEGDPTTLVRLEFSGDSGLALGERQAAFDLEPGSRLSLHRLDAGIEQLRQRYRQRGFYNATISFPQIDVADGRAVVGLKLESGPRFFLQVRGHRSFSEKTLLAQTDYRGQKPLDAPTLRELAGRIQTFYELAGFPHATVEARESLPPERVVTSNAQSRSHRNATIDQWGAQIAPASLHSEHEASANERLITFLVREGPAARVVDRVFEGLNHFTERELLERIDAMLRDASPAALRTGRTASALQAAWISGAPGSVSSEHPTHPPEEVFASAAYQKACAQIVSLYRSRGYLDAIVGPARFEQLSPGTGRVVIPVVEGRQTLIESVHIEGAHQVPARLLAHVPSVRAGEPLSFFAVEESRQALVSAYHARGFLYVQVDDEELIDEENARALVRFTVEEGAAVRVSSIDVRGIARTDPSLVRSALALREGDLVTPLGLQESVRNLLELGLFSSASVEPADPDRQTGSKVIIVELREKPSRRLELRLGASRADGPRTSASLQVGNLAGRNETVLLSAKLNWPFPRLCSQNPESCTTSALPEVPWERRFNLSLVLPSYSGLRLIPADMRLDALHENLLRPAFQLERYAGVVSFDGLLRRRVGRAEVSAVLQIELERDEFQRRATASTAVVQTLADFRAQLLPEGRILLVSVRPALTVDLRDDKANPTSGLLASLSVDASRSLATTLAPPGDTIQLLRTLLSASGWVPINRERRVIVAMSGRIGGILKADDSVVIGTKRFFLGGTQTLRGFNEDNLIPQDVRERLHDAVDRCRSLSSGLGCTDQVRDALGGTQSTSEGGEIAISGRLELRFGVASGVDGALLADAGNLWLDPSKFDPLNLRGSTGVGVRIATPIGPAAIDVAWNLARDLTVNEPLVQVHFSVGSF